MINYAAESRELDHIWDMRVPMRDGVRLSMDIFLPPGGLAAGPYPVILKRTPYNKNSWIQAKYLIFMAMHGYAGCIMDLRGLNESEGVWKPWVNDGRDGYDAIEWIAQQPWCNGKIGTLGGSYPGWVQWSAARERPPHLTTMMISGTAAVLDRRVGNFLHGGARITNVRWLWGMGHRTTHAGSDMVDWNKVLYSLPLKDMDRVIGSDIPTWREWLDHPTMDDYWKPLHFSEDDFRGIDIPVYHLTGWHDFCQQGTFFYWDGLQKYSPARDKQWMLVGPWDHFGTVTPRADMDGVDFTSAAVPSLEGAHLRWFDYWLKGIDTGVINEPKLKAFEMGSNTWFEAPAWPLEDTTDRTWYLGDGTLTGATGDDGSRSYVYGPADPIIIEKNAISIDPTKVPEEPVLQRSEIEQRADVIAYTSEPLDAPLSLCGFVEATLHGGSDCPDTDWIVWLSDVDEAGNSIMVADGKLRARYREDPNREVLMEAGETYTFPIRLEASAHRFDAGHRIRFAIASSGFPTTDRNPNTGHPIGQDAEVRIATNTIRHGTTYPSKIVLPIRS